MYLFETCPVFVLPWMTQHSSSQCQSGVVCWVELSHCWHWCQWTSQCLVDPHMLDQSHTEQCKWQSQQGHSETDRWSRKLRETHWRLCLLNIMGGKIYNRKNDMTLKRAIITYVCTHAYSKRNQLCPSVIQSVSQQKPSKTNGWI